MKKFDVRSALVGAVITLIVTFSVVGATGGRTVWDYRVLTGRAFQDELGKTINSSVAEGWEFVSAFGSNNENWGFAVMRREKN